MKTSLERERELSYKLLSDARLKKEGYDSHAVRHTLSASVTARRPAITPYAWQIDLAEALTLGTRRYYCYRWYWFWENSTLGSAAPPGRKS